MFGNKAPVSLSVLVSLNDGLSANVIVMLFPSICVFAIVPCVLLRLYVPSSFFVTLNSMSCSFAKPSGANVSCNMYVCSSCLLSSNAYRSGIVTIPACPISSVAPIFPVSYLPSSFPSFISLNFAPDNRFSSFPFSTFFIVRLYVGISSFSILRFIVGISFSVVVVFVFTVPCVMFAT